MLPQEMGCGSGVTCWRRLRYWQRRGVWKKLLHALLDRLGREGHLDWSKAVVDSQTYRAIFGGVLTGPNPTDRAKKGSKRHLLVDGKALPWRSRSRVPSGTSRSWRCHCSTLFR
jgi:transposase